MIDTLDFEKLDGLVPAVVQHAQTGEVLMVGFMNRDAVAATLRDRTVTFWSRTRQTLWKKGETSGHTLEVVDVTADCNHDALLIRAQPHGPTCHTGDRTCFSGAPAASSATIGRLEEIVLERRARMPEGSYTTTLFREGTTRIAQKVGEEAVETVLAAIQRDNAGLTSEATDLLYHLTVLLVDRGLRWDDIARELQRRMPSASDGGRNTQAPHASRSRSRHVRGL